MNIRFFKVFIFFVIFFISPYSVAATHVYVQGTLVVMIPTNEGVIIASDSRSSISGSTIFDDVQKISVINKSTAFIITGTFEILPKPPTGISVRDWVIDAPRLFSFEEVAEKYLMNNQASLSNQYIEAIATVLIQKLSEFINQHPENSTHLKGRNLCQLVIAQYDALTKASHFGHLKVCVSTSGDAKTTETWIKTYSSLDEPPFLRFGESDYLNNEVLSSNGKYLLPQRFHQIGQNAKRIELLSLQDGAFMAYTLIEAASEQAKIVPPKTAIGGPTYVILINGINEPTRLRPENGFVIGP